MRQIAPRPSSDKSRTGLRLTAVLTLIVFAILVGRIWEDSHVTSLRQSCSSLFEDRLKPATMLLDLLDDHYVRRELLRTSVAGDHGGGVAQQIEHHSSRQEETLRRFARTFLVPDEEQYLASVRGSLEEYGRFEAALLERVATGELGDYEVALQKRFEAVREGLLSLTLVQHRVAAELDAQSASYAARARLMIYFQLGLGVVLGFMASGLAMSFDKQSQSHSDVDD